MHENFSIAIFPFLKTRQPVKIGGFSFQATDNYTNLGTRESDELEKIKNMIFLRDDLLISSSVFTVIYDIEITDVESYTMLKLRNTREILCYMYAAPHPIFGNIHLSPEYVSMACLSPARLGASFLDASSNTRIVERRTRETGKKYIDGFNGIYNFKNYFWVAEGSRIYGPAPLLSLNGPQELSNDFYDFCSEMPAFSKLAELLEEPANNFSSEFFRQFAGLITQIGNRLTSKNVLYVYL